MRRSVFANAECVVRPNEFDGQFHQRSHANSRFHVVGEYEECGASSDDPAMQRHAQADAGHGEFGYAGLQECAAEVAACHGMSLFEESVGFVGVRQVGRRYNHVFDLLSQLAEYCSRSGACCAVGLLFYFAPINFRCFTREELFQFGGQFGIGFRPFGLCGTFFGDNFFEFGFAFGVNFFGFGKELESIVGVAAECFHRIAIGIAAEWCAVCCAVVFETRAVGFECAFAHDGVSDDECRAFVFGFGCRECFANGFHIVSVDFDDTPTPCFVFFGGVFAGYGSGFGR